MNHRINTPIPGSTILFARSAAAILAVSITIAALIPVSASAQVPPMPAQPSARSAPVPAQTIPDFSFTKSDNSPFTQKDLPKEKKIFFMLFDPTCEHCQRAIGRINNEYKTFQQTAVYLISMADWDQINRFFATYAPRLREQKNILLLQDKPGLFIARFRPHKFPAMFLYSAGKKLIEYEDNEATVFRFVHAISGK